MHFFILYFIATKLNNHVEVSHCSKSNLNLPPCTRPYILHIQFERIHHLPCIHHMWVNKCDVILQWLQCLICWAANSNMQQNQNCRLSFSKNARENTHALTSATTSIILWNICWRYGHSRWDMSIHRCCTNHLFLLTCIPPKCKKSGQLGRQLVGSWLGHTSCMGLFPVAHPAVGTQMDTFCLCSLIRHLCTYLWASVPAWHLHSWVCCCSGQNHPPARYCCYTVQDHPWHLCCILQRYLGSIQRPYTPSRGGLQSWRMPCDPPGSLHPVKIRKEKLKMLSLYVCDFSIPWYMRGHL